MTIEFDSIALEVYIDGAWLDIWPHVLETPGPRWNMGIMGNDELDRIGGDEDLSFSLNNTPGEVLGYYTPGHANVFSANWNIGLTVRLVFTLRNIRFYKFRGKIYDIQVTPGTLGMRDAKVKARGWIAETTQETVIDLPEYALDKYGWQVMDLIVGYCGVTPLSMQSPLLSYQSSGGYAAGSRRSSQLPYLFPTVFDTNRLDARPVSEMQKITMSDLSYIYTKGNKTDGQTLVYETRRDDEDSPSFLDTSIPVAPDSSGACLREDAAAELREDGGACLRDERTYASFDNNFQGMKVTYCSNLYNKIIYRVYPRSVDATATNVLFSLASPIQMDAGITLDAKRASYTDPDNPDTEINGIEMVAPVSGTDFAAFENKDGTGTNYTANLTVTVTYGTEGAEYTLANTGGADFYVTKLQFRGKGIRIYQPMEEVLENEASQALSVRRLEIDAIYRDAADIVGIFAGSTLENYFTSLADARFSIDQVVINPHSNYNNMYTFLYGEPGFIFYLVEDMTGINGNWYINGYEASIYSKQYVSFRPILYGLPGTSGSAAGISS